MIQVGRMYRALKPDIWNPADDWRQPFVVLEHMGDDLYVVLLGGEVIQRCYMLPNSVAEVIL